MRTEKDIQHLFNRAGFGMSPQDFSTRRFRSRAEAVRYLFNFDKKRIGLADVYRIPPATDDEMSREISEVLKAQIKDINKVGTDWLSRMGSNPQNVLLEKMSLYWHGHFACKSKNALFAAQQLDLIRENALGNFRDLVLGFSKDASMITYLDNQRNRKNKPNENYARELMELFTIGRGNYTEQDVKEGARAFTGWFTNKYGEFNFLERQHDYSEKTFMGKTGKFDGEDIIDIILARRETAVFVVTKIYRYFVNEEIDTARVQSLANLFYDSGYDISALMRRILESDWFYDPENRGTKIKSPVELLAGMMYHAGFRAEEEKDFLKLQRALAQVLFSPPNVAGWPGGKSWINNSTLLTRVNLPSIVAAEQKSRPRGLKKTTFGFTYAGLAEMTAGLNEKETVEKLVDYLLATPASIDTEVIKKYANGATRRDFVEKACVRIMSLPEYQMC